MGIKSLYKRPAKTYYLYVTFTSFTEYETITPEKSTTTMGDSKATLQAGSSTVSKTSSDRTNINMMYETPINPDTSAESHPTYTTKSDSSQHAKKIHFAIAAALSGAVSMLLAMAIAFMVRKQKRGKKRVGQSGAPLTINVQQAQNIYHSI